MVMGPGLLTGSNELSLERIEGTPTYNSNHCKMTSQIMYMFDFTLSNL